MIERRQLFAAGGLLSALVGSADAAGGGQSGDRDNPQTVEALRNIRTAIGALKDVPEIGAIRQRQLEFLKAQGKFPDFIDASAELWFAVYDWHVKNMQPVTIGRDGSGRYTIMLLFTTIVMRPDTLANYISVGYDAR